MTPPSTPGTGECDIRTRRVPGEMGVRIECFTHKVEVEDCLDEKDALLAASEREKAELQAEVERLRVTLKRGTEIFYQRRNGGFIEGSAGNWAAWLEQARRALSPSARDEKAETPDREVAPRTYGQVYIPAREKETSATAEGMSVRPSASKPRADPCTFVYRVSKNNPASRVCGLPEDAEPHIYRKAGPFRGHEYTAGFPHRRKCDGKDGTVKVQCADGSVDCEGDLEVPKCRSDQRWVCGGCRSNAGF